MLRRGVLYYVTIVAVMLGAITGSSMAMTIIMGSATLRRIEEDTIRLLTGVITASGSLAQLIPPSIFMVIFGGLSMLSVGKLLIGGILPGLLLASLFVIFIIIASIVKPDIMPIKGSISPIHWMEKLNIFLRDVLPLSLIFITITGVIYFNLGTPTEAAAGGAFATLVLAAAHKKLGWVSLKKSISGTLRTTSMVLLIIGGAKAFSQILTWTGVSRGVSLFVVGLQLPSLLTLFALLGILVIMGCFMEGIAIMFITVPFYFPIASTFGWDPLWLGILMVMAINLGVITPPFGVALFALKGVSPPGVSMADIFSGSIPFTILTLIGLVFLSLVPSAVVWLPNMMK
jgi:tripartite ATP-independent transporter DctM subunit